MKQVFLLLVALLLQSCATSTPKTDALLTAKLKIPRSSKLSNIPFIKQKENHCGPASLAMILKSHQRNVNMAELSSQMITPGSKGTYSTDLITAVRRQGMLAIKVNDLESLLTELSAGNPVLVFQNLGFSWLPKWHYAVAVGHNLDGPDIILHSGDKKFKKTDMRFFERSWSLTNFWGLVIIEPGKLAESVNDLGHVEGISGLEQVGKFDEALKAYRVVLRKWPKSLPALIGIGNSLYSKEEYLASIRYLKSAVEHHPDSGVAWHNLATAQGAAGRKAEASVSAHKSLTLVTGPELENFKTSLKEILYKN